MTTDPADAAPQDDPSLFQAPPLAEQERMLEAMLFASAEPLTLRQMEARMPHGSDAAEAMVLLRKRYEGRGVTVVRVGDAWALRVGLWRQPAYVSGRSGVEPGDRPWVGGGGVCGWWWW